MSKHKAKKRLKWCKHIKSTPEFFNPEQYSWTVHAEGYYGILSEPWKFCPYCGEPKPKGKL